MPPSPSAAPSTGQVPALAILFLSFAAFGSGISMRITDAQLPALANEFATSLGNVSYVITFFSIAYGIAQLFFGPLGDRFGKYRVIAWACGACAVSAFLCALAPGFSALLVARLLAGATAAAVIPLAMAWIGDVVDYGARQSVLARFLIGQILGLSTGVWLGGIAADHLSWRVPFFGISVGYVAICLALLSMNRRLPEFARLQRPSPGHVVTHMVNEFREVLAVRWARVVLLTVLLEGAFLYGAFAFIASHLHHTYGVSLSRAGAVVMLFGFGGFLFATLSGKMVKRLGEAGLSRWGGTLLAAALFAIGLAPSWLWSIPGCFIAGLGFYMFHNTLQINATQMAPERRGVAVSAFASCFFLGQAIGVAVAGVLVERIGTGAVIGIFSAGVLGVALNFARLRARQLEK
jgi:predicted MFS family arabinose efflux permease